MGQSYWEKNQKKSLKGYRKHIDVFVSAMRAFPERIGEAQFRAKTENEFIELLPKLPLHPVRDDHLHGEERPRRDEGPVYGTPIAC